ncbi:TPA: nucleoid-associated protein [Stenotrophomonas maltophilia]
MDIKGAVVHKLGKEQHSSGPGSVEVHLRDKPLPLDDTLASVCSQTLNLFQRKGNNTGTFGVDEDIHRFPVRVGEFVKSQLTFSEFTAHVVKIIGDKMEQAPLSNGGHAFFVNYTSGGDEFLLIAMLKLREGAGIDEVSLDLMPTLVIDTDKLHEAARLNVTRWQFGDEPYLTFIKGRGADEVTTYFREALSCVVYTSSKHHTSQMIAAANAYVADLPLLDQEAKKKVWTEVRERLFECFSSNKEEVVLAAIAVAVDPLQPHLFEEYVTIGVGASKYQVSHQFKPDRTTYSSLRRIRGKMGTVAVAFEVEDVRQGRVAYDDNSDALLIFGPSADLKKEIEDNVSPGA